MRLTSYLRKLEQRQVILGRALRAWGSGILLASVVLSGFAVNLSCGGGDGNSGINSGVSSGTPGALDTSFLATGDGANSTVSSVAVQGDSKILISGQFTTFNGTARGHVARLNTDGSLDTSLLATGDGANSAVSSVAVQSDSQILIGGPFTTYNGVARGHIARLNTDGSLDTSFLATGDGANNAASSVTVQSDSKILIGGSFTAYNGVTRGHVARLNYNGSLDISFLTTGDGANNAVSSVAVQSDNKILIGGSFTTYNGIAQGHVARLNIDGSLDTTFLATGAGAEGGGVFSIAVQGDGKILIGGSFTTYNGIARGHVARLNIDGSLDTTFLATGAGADDYVSSVAVQSDGKILIGGQFSTVNSTARGHVARLNTDGSLDTTFLATGVGADNHVGSVAMQSDGKILIGGSFATYNGVARGMIARLMD